MIAHIRGKITEKFGNSLIIDVAGVGYEITVPTPDFDAVMLDEEKKFFTYHSIRENAEELYGFSSLMAKKLFELLISVQGVGPKAGIAILSLAEPEEESAERVIVDLRDKVGIPSHYGATATKYLAAADANDEALDALMALGFSLKEASLALEKVDKSLSTEERIKLALKK